MNTTTCRRPGTTVAGICLVLAALGLAACNKTDERSAGEKVDAAIANTQKAAAEAGKRTEELADEARAKVQSSEPAMQKGYDNVKEAAKEAGAAMSAGMDEAAITASVSAGLAKDPSLSAIRIDVNTQGSTVTLRGPAPSAEAKARAEAIALGVKGVSKVDNQLEVKAM